jgi:pimeloyl-ACP methyl ester carboxylesterase
MTRSVRSGWIVCASLCAVAAAQGRPADKAPTPKELDELAARFFAADDKTEAGHRERATVLARVAGVPAVDARLLADWRKKIQKLWGKGRTLEKGGDNWFWPANKKLRTPDRGRYIVGGETQKPKGLAITMHGGGLGSGDAGPAAAAYEPALSKLGLLMIAPQVLEATERGWTDSGSEEFVLDLVDAALRTWKLDPDKVFFVGHSMGGYGSWMLGAHHADRTAAIAPSAGAPTPIQTGPGAPITGITEGVIPSLRNVFVSIYQSLDDPQVPPGPNQFAARALREAQQKWGAFEHDYWEVNGRGHAEPPGGYQVHLDKIIGKVRSTVPARVVWQPVLPWKRQFYWLYWDAPVSNVVVVADLDKEHNAVTITSDKPCDGLCVLLDDRVLDLKKEIAVTTNGTEVFRGKVEPRLDVLWLTSDHPDPELQFVAKVPASAKKDG